LPRGRHRPAPGPPEPPPGRPARLVPYPVWPAVPRPAWPR